MKALIAAMLFLRITSGGFAQQIIFANFGGGMSPAPVFDAAGNLVPASSPYVADFFWSANTNALMDNLAAAGYITSFNYPVAPGPGYFIHGTITLPLSIDVYILGQVRVWDTTYGATYYEARNNGGEFGFSNLIIVHPSYGAGLPTPLYGLQSFQLQRLPHLGISLTTSNTLLFFWRTNLTSYALQFNTGLRDTNWINVTNAPSVMGPENQIPLPKPQGMMFYRLVSQ